MSESYANYSDEPLEKILGVEDLTEAIIERVHFSQHHDCKYLDQRIELLCTWIGLEFDWQPFDGRTRLSSLEELIRGDQQLSKTILPFDGSIFYEGHGNRPDAKAYFDVREKMESEYTVVQSMILQIHRAYLSEFLMNLTTAEDREATFTLEDLVLNGLPRSEVVSNWEDE